MDLKMAAATRRMSVAAVVREKLGVKDEVEDRQKFWEDLDMFAKKMAKKYPNTRLSEKLIEMRSEQ